MDFARAGFRERFRESKPSRALGQNYSLSAAPNKLLNSTI
jgi:hypothetical protein